MPTETDRGDQTHQAPVAGTAGPEPGGSKYGSMRSSRMSSLRIVVLLGVLAVIAVVPFLANNYWIRVGTGALLFAGLGQALNIVYGMTGYPSLGNIVFFGIGAYTAGILAGSDVSAWITMPAGAVVAGLVALTVGRAMLSLRGSYFLMATVALLVLVEQIAVVASDLTGGTLGLRIPALVTGSPEVVYRTFYYLFGVALLVITVTLIVLKRSKIGLGMLAIRGNEDAAEAMGISTTRYKSIAWATSALFTGLLGAVYAYWIGFVDPGAVFDIILSVEMFLIVLIGGRYLILGPLIGAALIELIDITAWSQFTTLHLGILGLAILLLVLLLPGGVSQLRNRLAPKAPT